jgi:3-oxoacyl-[acyl-carrier protein] reductase
MNMSRNILITGATRGIGLALAQHYLEAGDTVIGCARSDSPLKQENYHHFSVDLSDGGAIKQLFISTRQIVSRLDALINNAGVARMNAFALTPLDSVQTIMQVNFNATFLCSQMAIGLLRKSATPRIVNFTTVAVPLCLEGEAAYASSKSAVETLTRITARELAPFGITCNAIGPSPIETDLIKGVDKKKIMQLVQRQAVKLMATPQDVINVVDFFLHPKSRLITGQVIYLGGIS